MSQIRETKLNPVPIQTGYGVPTHISPAGSFYFDFNTGIEYQNKDGVINWVQFFDSNNFTGGTGNNIQVTGGTYNQSTGQLSLENNTGGTIDIFSFNEDTGVYSFSGLSIPSSTGTTFNIAPVRGIININNNTQQIYYSGATGLTTPYLATNNITYVMVDSASTVVLTNTFPTPVQRRNNLFLGKLAHTNRTSIANVINIVDYIKMPLSQMRDMFTPIKLINDGVICSSNGTNLSFNTSAGKLYGNGINFTVDNNTPDTISITGQTPTTFQYRVQTGGTFSNTTSIDPANYDLNGAVTPIPGSINRATNQRIYLLSTGNIRIQYGQQWYQTLAAAVAGVQSEAFIEHSNTKENGILIGVLSLIKGATALNNNNEALFIAVSKFGEAVGASAGVSTTTLQQAYDNSTTPEIIINSTLDGLSIQNGTGNADAITKLLEGKNASGATTSFLTADGGFSGSSLSAMTYYGLPIDVNVTGGTYISSSSTITFTNNTGGTFNVTGITATGGGSFTGGTVSGDTIFISGLSANTISATTYQNLPIYQRLNDNDTVNQYNYCGSAISGTSQNSPTWNISRISWSSTTPTILSAYGAWSGRTSLIYT